MSYLNKLKKLINDRRVGFTYGGREMEGRESVDREGWRYIYIYIYTYTYIYICIYSKDTYIFNSYSSRTRRIWADIYNQRGRRPELVIISSYPASPRRITVLVNFQAILLISSGETSSNRDIFFSEDAAKRFFPTSKISTQEIRHQFFLIW